MHEDDFLDDIDSLEELGNDEFEDQTESMDEDQGQQQEKKRFGEDEYNAARDENGKYNNNHYKAENERLNQNLQDAKAERAKGTKEKKGKVKRDQDTGKVMRDPNTGKKLREDPVTKNKNILDKAKDNKRVFDAKNAKFQNKINSAKSKAFKTMHPLEYDKNQIKGKAKTAAKNTAKKAGKATIKNAKKAGKATVKGVKIAAQGIAKLVALAVEFWPVTLGIVIFALLIFMLCIFAGAIDEEKNTDQYGYTASTCQYNLNGINENTKIELINCQATKDDYTVLETISFEKYIAGVALAEMGENYVDEAMKAQLIAVRSYTLTRDIDKYGVGYDPTNNVIRMRACENDQVYWDYEKDIYRSANAVGNGVSKYSPEYTPAEGEMPWKTALSVEKINQYESLVSTVMGEYAADAYGNVVHTPYVDTITQEFITLANNNAGTVNGDYNAILMSVYPDIHTIEKVDCITPTYAVAGDYANWKQKNKLGGEEWGNIKLGTGSGSTINEIGCYVTSTAILIAHSGVPTTIENFNPGTFAEALKSVKSPPSFGPTGLWINKDNIKLFVPSYISMSGNIPLTGTKQEKINTLRKEAEAGEYIILVKRNDAHFMAMDNAGSAATGWTTIKVWDPAYNETDLFKTYTPSDITNYRILKLGGTI